MKANSILKIAIVAMAAFGAYAFSGKNNSSQLYVTYDEDIKNCTTDLVIAECDINGDEVCRINFNGKIMELYDLGCSSTIKHNSTIPVNWN